MGLTPKQRAFADNYLISLNASDAYKQVYTNCKNEETICACSSRLLRNANVDLYLRTVMAERSNQSIATAEQVLEFLSSTMMDQTTQTKDRIKCAELMGKRHKLFTDRIEAEVIQTVIFEGEEDLFEEDDNIIKEEI